MIKPVEPMKKWTVSYEGPMKVQGTENVVQVKLKVNTEFITTKSRKQSWTSLSITKFPKHARCTK